MNALRSVTGTDTQRYNHGSPQIHDDMAHTFGKWLVNTMKYEGVTGGFSSLDEALCGEGKKWRSETMCTTRGGCSNLSWWEAGSGSTSPRGPLATLSTSRSLCGYCVVIAS